MCGRFALRLDRHQIRNAIPDADEWLDEDAFMPRYNIAPRTYSPVIRRPAPALAPIEDRLVLHTMKWGLVPHWSKVEDKTLSTTNARAENLVNGGGMWSNIKGKNRCAVVCQGYYEWLTKGKVKLPHFTKMKDGNLMLLAGLYDHAVINGQSLWTFSIVTTDANPDFAWLHDRQPVILSTPESLNAWLDTSTPGWTPTLTKLVQPYKDTGHPLECYQVPKEVGKVGTESPSFIEPIKDRKDGIQAMFQKQLQSTSGSGGGTKRKHDSSPTEESKDDSKKEIKPEPAEEKKVKLRPTITPPSTPRKPKSSPTRRSTSPRKSALPPTPEKARITAFFRKK
ncbi:hypothetical protein AMATHDRAFT_146348 [Amanita thiersii Skay4041]|uniref:DUF159-domain-containing protein n=1 Tax=Amanita thiersii Skay4041 TaxID=703135 RepID=A0A2A9NQH3_9AGAR|nr:hypothetical protein AMATHDRAFT_146348 [Amanita thiersii Skay4041]